MAVSRNSYGHAVRYIGPDDYEISWMVDFKYRGSRLRHPRTQRRWTSEKGARRFAEKWKVSMPAVASTPTPAPSEPRARSR